MSRQATTNDRSVGRHAQTAMSTERHGSTSDRSVGRHVQTAMSTERHAQPRMEKEMSTLRLDDSDYQRPTGSCVQVSKEQVFFPTCAIREGTKKYIASNQRPDSPYTISAARVCYQTKALTSC